MEDGVLTAKIETPDEIYHIEPSWRHLEGESSGSKSMIAYKESDIKFSWNYPNEENFTPPKVKEKYIYKSDDLMYISISIFSHAGL